MSVGASTTAAHLAAVIVSQQDDPTTDHQNSYTVSAWPRPPKAGSVHDSPTRRVRHNFSHRENAFQSSPWWPSVQDCGII